MGRRESDTTGTLTAQARPHTLVDPGTPGVEVSPKWPCVCPACRVHGAFPTPQPKSSCRSQNCPLITPPVRKFPRKPEAPSRPALLRAHLVGFFSGLSASLVAQTVKDPQETQAQSLGREDPLEEDMATHCRILAWRSPRTEEPGGLQSTGLQRVGHD